MTFADKHYHESCFVCMTCKAKFQLGGQASSILVLRGEAICTACYEAMPRTAPARTGQVCCAPARFIDNGCLFFFCFFLNHY